MSKTINSKNQVNTNSNTQNKDYNDEFQKQKQAQNQEILSNQGAIINNDNFQNQQENNNLQLKEVEPQKQQIDNNNNIITPLKQDYIQDNDPYSQRITVGNTYATNFYEFVDHIDTNIDLMKINNENQMSKQGSPRSKQYTSISNNMENIEEEIDYKQNKLLENKKQFQKQILVNNDNHHHIICNSDNITNQNNNEKFKIKNKTNDTDFESQQFLQQQIQKQQKITYKPKLYKISNPINEKTQDQINYAQRIKDIRNQYMKKPLKISNKKQQDKQQIQNLPINYQQNYDNLQAYLLNNSKEILKITNHGGKFDKSQAFWIVKKIFGLQDIFIYAKETDQSDYFEGITNKIEFQNKLQAKTPNIKMVTFDDLINFIDQWFQSDDKVIVKYDQNSQKQKKVLVSSPKMTNKGSLEKKDNISEKKQQNIQPIQKSLKKQIYQSIEHYKNLLENCPTEDEEKKQILQKTLEQMQFQLSKISNKKEKQRMLNLKDIYDNYAKQSNQKQQNNISGITNEYTLTAQKYIQFFKDFGLFNLYLKQEVIMDVFKKYSSSSHILTFEEFEESLYFVSLIIQPSDKYSELEKYDQFFKFIKLDYPKEYKRCMNPYLKQQENDNNFKKIFQKNEFEFQTPVLKNKGFKINSQSKSPQSNRYNNINFNNNSYLSDNKNMNNINFNNNIINNNNSYLLNNSKSNIAQQKSFEVFKIPMKNVILQRSLSPQARSTNERAQLLEELEKEKRYKTYQQVVYSIDNQRNKYKL